MNSRVVIPSNGSERSLAAVAPGHALAIQLGVSCELLSVVASQSEAAARESDLSAALQRAGHENIPIRVEVSEHPATLLLGYNLDEALLCMTTHARGPLRELVLGSVAADVVRRAHRPIVLAGPRLSVHWAPPIRTLLVCMDNSEQAARALDCAVELARSLGAELQLVHVFARVGLGEAGTGAEGADWLTGADLGVKQTAQGALPAAVDQRSVDWEQEHTSEWQYLKDHAERIRQQTGVATDWMILEHPHPATGVAQLADSIPGALIVTGTHDVSLLERFGMGSFAMSVLRSAGVPVAVVSS